MNLKIIATHYPFMGSITKNMIVLLKTIQELENQLETTVLIIHRDDIKEGQRIQLRSSSTIGKGMAKMAKIVKISNVYSRNQKNGYQNVTLKSCH